MKRKKLLYNSFEYSFFEARFLYKNEENKNEQETADSKKEKPKAKKAEVVAESEKSTGQLKANVEGKKGRDEVKKDVEGSKLPELPGEEYLKEIGFIKKGYKQIFIEKIDSGKARKELDPIEIQIGTENSQVNSENWEHFTLPGLQKVMLDCKNAKIPVVGNKFYQSMFAVLRNAADTDTNPHLAGGSKYLAMFRNPAEHLDELNKLPPDPHTGFLGGDVFVAAWEHLDLIKKLLHKHNQDHIATLKKQEEANSPKLAKKATDFVSSNLSKFKKAIRERDYATAGVYAVGIWAIYHSFKKLTKNKDGTTSKTAKKWMMYGAALYAGNMFLENAGYDVLKMAGFRDPDYEVEGTPFESMRSILRANPELNEKTKDLDYGVVLKMSEVNLKDLHKLYEKSNDNGNFFIHPYKFTSIFPALSNEYPFDMGLAEKGIRDNTGMTNTKLTPGQREYVRVGQQIYKLALSLKGIYDETLYQDHPAYRGTPYKKALNDPVRKLGKVRHLVWIAREYAPDYDARKLNERGLEQAQKEIKTAFDEYKKEIGLEIGKELGPGHYLGSIKGMPVVFVKNGDKYRVYLKSKYRSTLNPGPNYIREISVSGLTRKNDVKKIVEGKDGVDDEVKRLLGLISGSKGKVLKKPKYQNGEWTYDIEVPADPEFVLAAEPWKGKMEIKPDGKGLTLFIEGTSSRVNVYDNLVDQFPSANRLIADIISQKTSGKLDFQALSVFSNADQLRITDPTPGDKKITLMIGKNNMPLEMKHDGKKFVIANPAQETALVTDPLFANEYVRAIEADEKYEFNQTIDKLKDVIKHSPEKFFPHMWDKISFGLNKTPISGMNTDAFSGSVPEYFSNVVLENTRYQAMEKLRRGMQKAKSLKEIQNIQSKALEDTNSALKGVYTMLSTQNMDSSWDRNDYVNRVLYPIRAAGGKSGEYNRQIGDFEYQAYRLTKNILTSDFNERSHKNAGQLLNVFAYYTSYLDNEDYTNPSYNPSLPKSKKNSETIKIDLDNLSWPPKQSDPSLSMKVDPGMRGHYVLNYMTYVKREILNRTRSNKDRLDNLPNGSSKTFWKIKEFDDWLTLEGTYIPQNPLDNLPALKGGPRTKTDEYNETDEAIMDEFDKAWAFLQSQYPPGTFNTEVVQNYLRLKPAAGISSTDVGIFMIQKDPSDTSKRISKLWDMSNRISPMKKRSEQVKAIQELVDRHLIREIFETPDKYLTKKPPFTARMVQKWPWLYDIPYVPDAVNPFN